MPQRSAIARASKDLPPRGKGKVVKRARKNAQIVYEPGEGRRTPGRRLGVSRSAARPVKREPLTSASLRSLAKQARSTSSESTPTSRAAAARKAAHKKATVRRSAARKAAHTRRARQSH